MIIRSPKELALLVIAQRKQLGLTQAEVADRVGLKQKTISAFENKPESAMLTTAFLILSALCVNLQAQTKSKDGEKTTPWAQEW
jgi:HTH-type transcriptional regulator / antitoxin HipB